MRAPTPEQMRALADRAQQWSDRAGIKHKPGQTLVEFAAALRAAADEVDKWIRIAAKLGDRIDNAPHDRTCTSFSWNGRGWDHEPDDCTCWKSDAL